MLDAILIKDIAAILNAIDWDILEMLNRCEKLSYSEIKSKLNISQNKISKELARLEGALLIETRRDEVDSRMLNFSITQYGTKILSFKI